MVLSEDQKTAIESSWDKAKANWGTDGQEYYIALFKEIPETFPYFKYAFKGKDVSEVRMGTPELIARTIGFKAMVDSWVKNIDDDNALNDICVQFAKRHADRKVPKELIKRSFGFFGRFCGRKYEADIEAWKVFLDIIYAKIEPCMSNEKLS